MGRLSCAAVCRLEIEGESIAVGNAFECDDDPRIRQLAREGRVVIKGPAAEAGPLKRKRRPGYGRRDIQAEETR